MEGRGGEEGGFEHNLGGGWEYLCMDVCISFSREGKYNDLSWINFGVISNHLANSLSSELIPHLYGSGGNDGGDFSSWRSKRMSYMLSLHEPAEKNYMI